MREIVHSRNWRSQPHERQSTAGANRQRSDITITNALGVLRQFINDPENLTLFEYREPVVLRRIGEKANAEQPAAGDEKERADVPFLAPELERS